MLRDEKLRQKIREIDWDEDSSVTNVNVNLAPPKSSSSLHEKAFDWAIGLPRWQLLLFLTYAAGAAWVGHRFGWF